MYETIPYPLVHVVRLCLNKSNLSILLRLPVRVKKKHVHVGGHLLENDSTVLLMHLIAFQAT